MLFISATYGAGGIVADAVAKRMNFLPVMVLAAAASEQHQPSYPQATVTQSTTPATSRRKFLKFRSVLQQLQQIATENQLLTKYYQRL